MNTKLIETQYREAERKLTETRSLNIRQLGLLGAGARGLFLLRFLEETFCYFAIAYLALHLAGRLLPELPFKAPFPIDYGNQARGVRVEIIIAYASLCVHFVFLAISAHRHLSFDLRHRSLKKALSKSIQAIDKKLQELPELKKSFIRAVSANETINIPVEARDRRLQEIIVGPDQLQRKTSAAADRLAGFFLWISVAFFSYVYTRLQYRSFANEYLSAINPMGNDAMPAFHIFIQFIAVVLCRYAYSCVGERASVLRALTGFLTIPVAMALFAGILWALKAAAEGGTPLKLALSAGALLAVVLLTARARSRRNAQAREKKP